MIAYPIKHQAQVARCCTYYIDAKQVQFETLSSPWLIKDMRSITLLSVGKPN